MQGRLQGKRFAVRFFLDEVLRHGAEGCTYLLAVDSRADASALTHRFGLKSQ
ncbi:hypothetical protein GCM10027162_58010 [Streptomyces incanus]